MSQWSVSRGMPVRVRHPANGFRAAAVPAAVTHLLGVPKKEKRKRFSRSSALRNNSRGGGSGVSVEEAVKRRSKWRLLEAVELSWMEKGLSQLKNRDVIII